MALGPFCLYNRNRYREYIRWFDEVNDDYHRNQLLKWNRIRNVLLSVGFLGLGASKLIDVAVFGGDQKFASNSVGKILMLSFSAIWIAGFVAMFVAAYHADPPKKKTNQQSPASDRLKAPPEE